MKNPGTDSSVSNVSEVEKVKTKIPEWSEGFVVGIKELQYRGKIYEYIVVDAKIKEKYKTQVPKMFATFSYGALGLTNNIPQEYWEPYLAHEIRDTELTGEKACLESLKEELEKLEEAGVDMKEYISFRKEFFTDAIDFYESNKSSEGDKILVKLRHSYEHLKELTQSEK